MTQPGWFADPAGTGRTRYWDGMQWTNHFAPDPVTVVEGPNHVLHGILTLLTFPLCGGWGWIWLIVAMNSKKSVRRL